MSVSIVRPRCLDDLDFGGVPRRENPKFPFPVMAGDGWADDQNVPSYRSFDVQATTPAPDEYVEIIKYSIYVNDTVKLIIMSFQNISNTKKY